MDLEKFFENLRQSQMLADTFKQLDDSIREAMKSSNEFENQQEDVHGL